MPTHHRPRPLLLIILDGWGHRETTEYNAIYAAKKPHWDDMMKHNAHTLISGSGRCVGLPDNQMGNSEVGHLNIGAGRIVHQDLTRIDDAIKSGEFYKNEALLDAFSKASHAGKAVHVMGLLSSGGVHSHERQIHAIIDFAIKNKFTVPLYIHAFLDGRDTPPRSAMASLDALLNHCQAKNYGQIVSLIGRYYAMDRDKRWDRIHLAYDLLVQGKAPYTATCAKKALELAYERGENDEFVKPTTIHDHQKPPIVINDFDSVIFMNFRADRARLLTESFIDPNFHGFKREKYRTLGKFVCLSEYDAKFAKEVAVAFPLNSPKHIFAEYISSLNLKQLRIAETEKYAHVTFFFNGGIETPYPFEDRILIPSPQVATYDLQPEMSAFLLTDRLINEIKSARYDVIICNFANPDMVGHTGNFKATVKAIETIDQCLGKIIKVVTEVGGELIITADHGNAEKMYDDKTNQPHTAHTNDPVPFIYMGRKAKITNKNGKLSDIAPTLLYLLGLSKPIEMTGETLVELIESP